jgi:AAA family ATP:ADP antiporter
VFFTVIGREEKYKAKNLIDVVVYRGSDALYGWVFDGLQALGLKLGAIALVAWPAAAGWLVLSMVLGRAQEHRAALIDSEAAKPSDATPGDANFVDANLGDADISVASEGDAMTGERA